jgi:hypothetical protein
MTEPPDDLADVLAPQPGQPAQQRRDAILRATERQLARDRWLRRAARLAVVAAVFLAGGLAGWFARTPGAHAPGSPNPGSPAPDVVVVTVPVPVWNPGVNTPGSPGSPGPSLSASEAELRAEQMDDAAEAARLYRLAGDAFLRGEDYANATRCYRLFLARGGDTVLSLEADDSWLLVSLKNAAFKEKVNVVSKIDG